MTGFYRLSSCAARKVSRVPRSVLINRLVLASSSPYRRALLERLALPFEHCSPCIDESPREGEYPKDLVLRLASAKAAAVAHEYPNALIIGSDQLAVCEQRMLGKPGSHTRALEQLLAIRGRQVSFLTSLCLLNTVSGREQLECVTAEIVFREYDEAEARRYLEREKPYHCAAAFKSEALGISLVESLTLSDPNALVGLPLLALSRMLREEGLQVP